MPVISRITIENFQCIEKVTVDLPDFGVLVGANDSGKSSFLKAIDVLARILRNQGQAALANPDGLLPAMRRDENGAHRVALDALSQNKFRYRISASSENDREEATEMPGRPKLTYDARGIFQGSEQLRGGFFPPPFLAAVPDRAQPELVAAAVLSSASVLRLAPEAVADESGNASLAPDGRGLPSVLANLALTDRPKIQRIEQELQHLTGGRVVGVATPVSSNRSSYGLEFVLASGIRVPARSSSTGLLYALAILSLVYASTTSRILLVEEPENGVHPGRLKEMVALLRRLTRPENGRPACQILLATHSPYLLDECTPDEVLVFQREGPGGWTTISRPSPDVVKRGWGLHLGELWGSFGERGLLEGPTPAETPTVEHDS